MRRATLIVNRAEASEGGFADLYRRYVQICREEDVEPMPPKALLAILRALAAGDEMRESGPTLH